MNKDNIGSTFDSFLVEEELRAEIKSLRLEALMAKGLIQGLHTDREAAYELLSLSADWFESPQHRVAWGAEITGCKIRTLLAEQGFVSSKKDNG